MGQTLSEPVTAKESSTCQNSMYKVGSSCMQGWRVTMEDSHTHILSLPDDSDAAFFAVYDGHGGAAVAQYAGVNLHKSIVTRPEYKSGDVTTAIREGFMEFDNNMMTNEQMRDEVAGTTAVTVLIKGDQLYCGNVGDSRAVACINGKEHPLSADHKPNNPMELMRIKDAGGWVEYNRVNGNLALSRALGDFVFKRNPSKPADEQMVIALPDVETRTITEDWEFVILACDGVWDVMTNAECVETIRKHLGARMEPEKVCEAVMTKCLSPDCQMGGLGCDNMTVILICFLHGKSWEEYCAKIAASLEPNLNSLSSALASNGRERIDIQYQDDDEDAFLVDNAVNSNRDNDLESVSNPKPNSTAAEEETKPFQSDMEATSQDEPASDPDEISHQNGASGESTTEG